jgi:hypothetical protein
VQILYEYEFLKLSIADAYSIRTQVRSLSLANMFLLSRPRDIPYDFQVLLPAIIVALASPFQVSTIKILHSLMPPCRVLEVVQLHALKL